MRMSTRRITYLVPVLLKLLLGESSGTKAMKLINRWISESGVEWTCKRLKALRTGAIQLRAGSKELAIEVWKENSIAYNHGTGYPKGVFGIVVQRYCESRRPSSVRRMDTILRLYTSFTNKSLSKMQNQKAYKSITSDYAPETNFDLIENLCSRIRRQARGLKGKLIPPHKPNLAHLKAGKSCHIPVPLRKKVPESTEGTIYAKMCMSLVSSTWLPEALIRMNPCEELRQALIQGGADNEVAGHVAVIQEGGCKARFVAVPDAWVQWLMEPVHVSVDQLVQTLPESTVHDQNNGAYFMQEHLSQGHQLWCFDLSSATDRFPLKLQLAALEGLGLGDYAQALEEISKAKWEFKTEYTDELVSYKVGQPMGVYGSFPIFHLTHLLLLRSIVEMVPRNRSRCVEKTCFRVQGDDIIIADKEVAGRYQTIMQQLGVELSPVKTITSDRVGEFAGFITTCSNRAGYAFSYRPYKYVRPQGREPKLFNLCASLGKSYRRLHGRIFRKVDYDVFAATLPLRNPDLSPLIPEDEDEGGVPTRLDQQLLGSLLNKCCLACDRLMEVDRHHWRSYRRVLLGQEPLPPEIESGDFSDYSSRVKAGLIRDPVQTGVSNLDVTSKDRDDKSWRFGTHQQRDHLYDDTAANFAAAFNAYVQERADPSREGLGETNLFGD